MAITTKKIEKKDKKKLVIKNKNSQPIVGLRWWELTPEEATETITANLDYWIVNQTWRTNSYKRYAKLYMNLPIFTALGTSSSLNHQNAWSSDRLSFNVCQSCVDALTSQIPTKKVQPRFVSDGGNYKLQDMAEQLQMFVDGVMEECGTFKKTRGVFRNALINGDGWIHTYHKHGRIHQDLVNAMEVWVDEVESDLAEPTQMYRATQVDRDRLIAEFPTKKDIILQAKRVELPGHVSGPHMADLVTRIEAWRLPSKPGGEDGANIVMVDGKPLTDLKVWTRDEFPIRKFTYCERPVGWYGQGLIEQIEGIQREINQLLWCVKEALRLGTGYKWWVKSGSKVVVDHISNQIGAILRSEEKPEDLIPANLIQPEVYQRIAQCIQDAYQQSGVSQMSASSEKPQDLESGEALRVFNDIGSARFMSVGQDFEDFMVGLAKDIIATMQELEEEEGTSDYEVTVPNEQSLQRINWKQIKISDIDDFRIVCLPASQLPQTISGKLQSIQDMAQAGLLMDQATVMDLLDFPDLKRVENQTTAERKWITKRLDAIVDEGIYQAPDGYDNLQMAVQLGKQYLATGHNQNLPEKRVVLLQKWIDACTKLAQAQMQSQMPPPPPAPPQLPAKGQVAPVSPMLPPTQQAQG